MDKSKPKSGRFPTMAGRFEQQQQQQQQQQQLVATQHLTGDPYRTCDCWNAQAPELFFQVHREVHRI